MTVLIEPDKLHFSCTCGIQVKSVCIHVYKAIIYFLWNGQTNYFELFRPGGVMELAFAHREYFVSKKTANWSYFTPKKSLGIVYQLAGKLEYDQLATVLNLPTYKDTASSYQPKLTAISYHIMCSTQNRYLPFPIRCLGVLNKEGTDVKGFYPYMDQMTAENQLDSFLTAEEQALNLKCFEMYQLVESSPESILNNEGREHPIAIKLFGMWKDILFTLTKHQYVFQDRFYSHRFMGEKPRIRDTCRINIRTEIPKLYFQLIDKGAFYQFELKVSVKDNNIRGNIFSTPFFITDYNQFYLLGSVKDAAMVKWMEKSSGKLIVFKEHFQQFEKEILSPIWEHYDIISIINPEKRQFKNGSKTP